MSVLIILLLESSVFSKSAYKMVVWSQILNYSNQEAKIHITTDYLLQQFLFFRGLSLTIEKLVEQESDDIPILLSYSLWWPLLLRIDLQFGFWTIHVKVVCLEEWLSLFIFSRSSGRIQMVLAFLVNEHLPSCII